MLSIERLQMKVLNEKVVLSASDLVGYIGCNHLTKLDLDVANGIRETPKHYDPLLELLKERGDQHENSYLKHLKDSGLDYKLIEGVDISNASI